MGFFSWKTSDTDRSICNIYSRRETFPVYVLIPKEFGGGYIEERHYEGYGIFGGRDMYALVAQWNYPERCKDSSGNWLPDEEVRDLGIGIACDDAQNAALKFPIKIAENPVNYEAAEPSCNCPFQGYFY